MCFLVDFANIFRTDILKNTFGWLLLFPTNSQDSLITESLIEVNAWWQQKIIRN